MLWNDPFAPVITQLGRSAAFVPGADLTVDDAALTLTMDLPGLTGDDLSIEVQDSALTVRGQRTRPPLHDGTYLQAERPFGAFQRTIQIPKGVDPEAITASIHDGVLTLIVAKPEQIKPRRVPIDARNEQREPEPVLA